MSTLNFLVDHIVDFLMCISAEYHPLSHLHPAVARIHIYTVTTNLPTAYSYGDGALWLVQLVLLNVVMCMASA
eukprot:31503-Eustigmatos_ZCMA.PRE.1